MQFAFVYRQSHETCDYYAQRETSAISLARFSVTGMKNHGKVQAGGVNT
jgi:hypothetical protein